MYVVMNDAVLAERLGCQPIAFGRDGKPMPPPQGTTPNLLVLAATMWCYWPVIEGALDNGA